MATSSQQVIDIDDLSASTEDRSRSLETFDRVRSVQLGMATSCRHVINIHALSASTKKELDMLVDLTDDCCISRVFEGARKFNEHYYTPRVVSIGPIHYGKEELRAMEEYKKRYLKDFLLASSASIEEYYELVQINETKLRNCYANPIELDSEVFVKMALLDAVFLIMTILYPGISVKNMPMGKKRIMEKPKMIYDIEYDLVLLENQLPFFIIQELYEKSKIHNNWNISSVYGMSLSEETALITRAIVLFNNLDIIGIPPQHPTKVEHLLALLRSCLKPIDWNPKRKPIDSLSMPRIKELHQAGVKFKARRNQNLFDIGFNNGVLEIPTLITHNYTELLFRNLMAFEICNDLDLLCIDYIHMMERFTSDSEDSELLMKKKIITTDLPDAQAVSTLFHNLSPSLIFNSESFGYSDVVSELNTYYNTPWNRWKATWIQRYFKAPWAIFSFTGAVVLLILTIVQTVCSILQVT